MALVNSVGDYVDIVHTDHTLLARFTACPWSVASQNAHILRDTKKTKPSRGVFSVSNLCSAAPPSTPFPYFTNVFPGGVPPDNPLLRVVPRRRRNNSIALGGSAELLSTISRRRTSRKSASRGRRPRSCTIQVTHAGGLLRYARARARQVNEHTTNTLE